MCVVSIEVSVQICQNAYAQTNMREETHNSNDAWACVHSELTLTHVYVQQIEVARSVHAEKPSEPHFIAIVVSRVGASCLEYNSFSAETLAA